MIKRYLEFINEKYNGYNTLGEWVETLMQDHYISSLIIKYTNEIDYSVDLVNAINILDSTTKDYIYNTINKYLSDGLEIMEPSVSASVDISESNINLPGRNIFKSFLRAISALGLKDNYPDWDNCPKDFLIYYCFEIRRVDFNQVFNRFKSLSGYIINDVSGNIKLYFGINLNCELEYGTLVNDQHSTIGMFKINNTNLKWINNLESSSINSFKKVIKYLSLSDIKSLSNIKTDMASINIGNYKRLSVPKVTDRIITFGYYGIGKWEDSVLNSESYDFIKDKVFKWVQSKKWSKNVLISVKSDEFWVYIHIKLK